MARLTDLKFAAIIEKDYKEDVLWTWSYPTISEAKRQYLLAKLSSFNEDFTYFNHSESWCYAISKNADDSIMPKVEKFAVIVGSEDFNPEKYRSLLEALCLRLEKTGNPSKLLESYLSVVTKGACNGEDNGSFVAKQFCPKNAYLGGSLRSLVSKFGIQSILLYTAMLLKKRIAVYSSTAENACGICRSLPAFLWHRQNWNVVHPNLTLTCDLDVAEIRKRRHFVAGFTSADIEERTDLFDVFANEATGEITVATHAQEALTMGKIHKDIAKHIIQCVENIQNKEEDIAEQISAKTKALIDRIMSLKPTSADGDSSKLTYDVIRSTDMNSSLQTFLCNVATAEGLIDL